jgi:hypothetical protein
VSEPSVITATSEAVLIAWDMGQGPTYKADAPERVHALYRVYRNGLPIGDTAAEVFYDQIVYDGSVYKYEVFVVDGGSETPVGPVFTAHVPRRRIGKATTLEDRVAPTAPSDFAGAGVFAGGREGVLYSWTPSSDSGSGILAYFVESNNGSQPQAVLWNPDGKRTEWTEPVPASLARAYRLRALDGKLNLSEPSNIVKVEGGWTVYKFSAGTSQFTLKDGASLTADVLRVGAGGSGGAGNNQGGGGGGGEVIDLHGVEIVAGETDGEVVVGRGRGVPYLDALANACGYNGEDSAFGGVTARGGGYGSGESSGNYGTADAAFLYQAADGASGGGGDPWTAGAYHPNPSPYGEYIGHHGHGGAATAGTYSCNTRIPYEPGSYTDEEAERYALAPYGQSGYWEDSGGNKFWRVTRTAGHDGGDGRGYTAWYQITAGGGGGAHEPWRTIDGVQWPWYTYDQYGFMQSANPGDGKHGVPCDIAGYGPLWIAANQSGRMVQWYGGGGAGVERKVWLGYGSGKPGYGGGGEIHTQGHDGTGGGGGGGGTGGLWPHPVATPGPAGGDGVVIVRIWTGNERLVSYPLITGIDPETGQPTTDAPGVTITRLDPSQPHTDISGDEQCPRTYEETH